jgi:hypothetical protein
MHEEKLTYKQGCRQHHRDMQIVEQKTKERKPAIGLGFNGVGQEQTHGLVHGSWIWVWVMAIYKSVVAAKKKS